MEPGKPPASEGQSPQRITPAPHGREDHSFPLLSLAAELRLMVYENFTDKTTTPDP
jgi:hypothetical protein